MNHSDQTKQITAQTEKMLIDQYERLYRLAYSYVHNEADALDIVQESACKAITQCKNLKDTEKLFPWLCRIVVNTSLDLLRSRTKEQPAEELPETATEDTYEEFDLKEALNHLEPKNRTIIILRYFEDMKFRGHCPCGSRKCKHRKSKIIPVVKKASDPFRRHCQFLKERSIY